MITLTINGARSDLDVDPDMPLLWALRDVLGMTGTKYGCGAALCGACKVHLGGEAVPSCVTPVSAAVGADVTTIEGLSTREGAAVLAAWRDLQVAQCGYCQPGQIMQATALLARKPEPSDADIDEAMERNVCRCATYHRIRAGIHRASETLKA